MNKLASKVAARHFLASYFSIGDVVLYGRWKNHRGKIVSFGQDKWGNPTVTVEPIPKGRKQPKTFNLFKMWKAEVKEKALAQQELAKQQTPVEAVTGILPNDAS